MKKILLLGGTQSARQIADTIFHADDLGVKIITSLAGITKNPRLPGGAIRRGGFGGASGLAAYLTTENISGIIDATHPYAAQISQNAWAASRATGRPLCRLERRPWIPDPKDNWVLAQTVSQAAEKIPAFGKRVFLTTGLKELESFFKLRQGSYWARIAESTNNLELPKNFTAMIQKGPLDLTAEKTLYKNLEFDLIVSKNSGGDATVAKIIAARELSLPIMMITRPKLPETKIFYEQGPILDWVRQKICQGV